MPEPRSVPKLRRKPVRPAAGATYGRGFPAVAFRAPGAEARTSVAKALIIPPAFWGVTYEGARYPGAPGVEGVAGGANCQQFAYELLRYNGFIISDMRSSELWADRADTAHALPPLQPGDLLLFHSKPEAWGAHVALLLGGDAAIHLAKHVGRPAIWTLADFAAHPHYTFFIGAKRPIRRRFT